MAKYVKFYKGTYMIKPPKVVHELSEPAKEYDNGQSHKGGSRTKQGNDWEFQIRKLMKQFKVIEQVQDAIVQKVRNNMTGMEDGRILYNRAWQMFMNGFEKRQNWSLKAFNASMKA